MGFVAGSLASIQKAALPCLGALGGMIVPIGIFVALNVGPGGQMAGWSIPMATDIAFAVGIYNLFKSRMPPGAGAFLLTLATVDDLGAIAVIATCFASNLAAMYLTSAAICTSALFMLCKAKIDKLWMYAVAGVGLWYSLLRGGINADIAGVVTALRSPRLFLRPRVPTLSF